MVYMSGSKLLRLFLGQAMSDDSQLLIGALIGLVGVVILLVISVLSYAKGYEQGRKDTKEESTK